MRRLILLPVVTVFCRPLASTCYARPTSSINAAASDRRQFSHFAVRISHRLPAPASSPFRASKFCDRCRYRCRYRRRHRIALGTFPIVRLVIDVTVADELANACRPPATDVARRDPNHHRLSTRIPKPRRQLWRASIRIFLSSSLARYRILLSSILTSANHYFFAHHRKWSNGKSALCRSMSTPTRRTSPMICSK